jgi:hypothetical protein
MLCEPVTLRVATGHINASLWSITISERTQDVHSFTEIQYERTKFCSNTLCTYWVYISQICQLIRDDGKWYWQLKFGLTVVSLLFLTMAWHMYSI